jgi:hypothetical protein
VTRWDAGERALSDHVRDAILAVPLLDFHEPVGLAIRPNI